MARPKIHRNICGRPANSGFKPNGIPMKDLEQIVMAADEFEAMRLVDLNGMQQQEAAVEMQVSRQTLANLVNTDRGSQYCSAYYQALLKRHNLQGSMSAKGCCYDNVCAESVFHSLKVECIHGERFISREIMRTTVFNYIKCDDNRWRCHSACGSLSPEQFENESLTQG